MLSHHITILDIAKRLGLSKSTVSRALTNNPNISKETKSMVLKTAIEMDYQPNLLALGLIRNRTFTLGIIIPDIQRPFYAAIVSGIQHTVCRKGYRVVIAQSDECPKVEEENIKVFMLNRVDGFFICHTRDTKKFDHVKSLHEKGYPIVTFARICPDLPIPKVVEDDFNGLYILTQHLIEKNKKRIALLAGPKHLLASRLRVRGYTVALQQHGIRYDKNLVANIKFKDSEVDDTFEKWMQMESPPDAICTIYDAGAIRLIQLIKAKGLRIPHDIAVVGFGDDPSASIIEPGLTSFSQKPYEIGAVAGKYMLDLLNEKIGLQQSEMNICRGYLIIRKSS
ncbi:MAG: LacI family DNA-binding transcriptional regulator [Sphingobacteriales bacterium]|jgi:DNA-binding LacI/PurR family transcriptional regulator|nr:LacI family DNA-binding transcriptional regulator [Sphingobacteriales bacterium]